MTTKTKKIPVKIEIIKTLYEAVLPIHYRVTSLLEDVVSGSYQLTEIEKAALLEASASSSNLKVLFEEYISQTNEHQADTLHLAAQEYANVLTMVKTVELSNRVVFGQTGIWVH